MLSSVAGRYISQYVVATPTSTHNEGISLRRTAVAANLLITRNRSIMASRCLLPREHVYKM